MSIKRQEGWDRISEADDFARRLETDSLDWNTRNLMKLRRELGEPLTLEAIEGAARSFEPDAVERLSESIIIDLRRGYRN